MKRLTKTSTNLHSSGWLTSLAALTILAVTGPLPAQRIRIPHQQDRPPGPALSPRQALSKMSVPDGFHVELVACEPNIVNPIAMTFDQRGRVWITESVEYPRRSAGVGRDRIKVLEDTDGDGVADKFTVFAEGLNIPSGIAVGHGGVWVANSPDILFLRDTDNDGKADEREVVVTGFGRRDTHELPNSLTWGPDGWLYGLNGVFNPSHVTYPPSSPHAKPGHPGFAFTCAMFRIHPKTREFQVFAEGTSNPWGITWDVEGSAFISACVIDHLWHITESGYYHRQGGPYPAHTWRIGSIVKHTHQKAAYCGIEFFDSDAYPEQYRERLYMGNIHGNCVNVDVLQREGSTYFARPAPDFLQANDVWFMPVAQKTGPDGCLYVLDWYDRYHCYQDANRDSRGIDRLRGRLYRIRYANAPRMTDFDLAQESDLQLMTRLSSPNIYFRQTAQRILQERNNAATRSKLQQLVLGNNVSRKAQMHALWSLIGGGPLESKFHLKLLSHDDAGLRAWAVRAAGNQRSVTSGVREKIAARTRDPSPDVRLQVAIAARKIEKLASVHTLVETIARAANDQLIPPIVWQNLYPLLEDHSDEFIRCVEQVDLNNTPSLLAIMPRVVGRMLARRDGDLSCVTALMALLCDRAGDNPQWAGPCFKLFAARVQSRELVGDDLTAIKSGLRPVIDQILAAGTSSPLYLDAALLATSWHDSTAVAAVRQTLASPAAASARRLDALQALIAAREHSLVDTVGTLLADRQGNSAKFRGQVIASLGRLDDPRLADVLLAAYAEMEPELKPRVIEMLTQRSAWSKRLLASIGNNQLPAEVLNLNQVRRLLSSGDEQLVNLVRSNWGSVRNGRDPRRARKIVEMKQFLRANPGDPFVGAEVYKKVCGQCHKIYGQGEDVGPDITLNGRNSLDQLLSNVLDPSLVIGASYRAYSVATSDGRVLTGLLVEDSPQRIVLKTQGGKVETIARSDVERLKENEISMMPEDLEKQLKPKEIADLFAFLVLDRPPSDPRARQLPGLRPITPRSSIDREDFAEIVAEVAPGFTVNSVGEGGLALLKEHFGRAVAVRTHPLNRRRPCILHGLFDIPSGGRTHLVLAVAHHPRGDWRLQVKVNGKAMLDTLVGPETTVQGWAEHTIDLSEFAGKKVNIELQNHSNDWSWEFGYWGRAAVISSEEVR